MANFIPTDVITISGPQPVATITAVNLVGKPGTAIIDDTVSTLTNTYSAQKIDALISELRVMIGSTPTTSTANSLDFSNGNNSGMLSFM